MSLSTGHFSSLLWSLRRLQQSWKWYFSRTSPEDPGEVRCVSTVDAGVSCPMSWQGVLCVMHSACASREPPTWVSVCDFSVNPRASQLLNDFRTSLFPCISSLLFLILMDLWFMLLCLCTLYSVARALDHAFYIENNQKHGRGTDPLSLFCLDNGDGSPVHRAVSFHLK